MAFQKGDTVKVHYKGTFDDGTEFDSSYETEPIEFVLGDGELIPRFEEAIIGRKSGEVINIVIQPEDAYGEFTEELILPVEKDQFPDDLEAVVGMPLQVEAEEGPIEVYIQEITDTHIVINGNHPLAGKILYFEIKIQ
ncbi:MAG: FKBP-type peptidyl-prolyl cis-trans isomerase [Desulfovibrionaceae bacterium]